MAGKRVCVSFLLQLADRQQSVSNAEGNQAFSRSGIVRNRRPIFVAAATIAGLAFIAPVTAQDDAAAPAADNYLENLKQCQAIQSDADRLTCYDLVVGRVVTASEEGEVRLVDREDVQKTRRRLFGFTIPDLGIFGGDDEGGMDILESTVKRVVSIRRDTIVFEIEEGSIWQIDDAPPRVLRRLDTGTPVVFKKAALGSYFIRVDGQTGVKGKRIQ